MITRQEAVSPARGGAPRSAAIGAVLLAGMLAAPVAVEAGAAWQFALRRPGPPPLGAAAGGLAVGYELVTGGVVDPIGIAHAGDGSGRLFILEQAGRIRIFADGELRTKPFLDLSAKVSCCSERGLLGLAFDPDYDVNGLFYVNYTDLAGDTVIARYSVSLNPNKADPNSEVVLESVDQPFSNHNGGHLAFGPDGMLYAGLGDGGSGGDPGNRAQDLSTLLGKLLRLDPDSPPGYIPADNPYVGVAGARDEIWSYGLRNPWRFSFDRLTGDLLLGDVGQNSREEVDFQPAASNGTENWGWKVLEGTSCFSDVPPGACADFLAGGSELPILEYTHGGGNCAITGGYRYRGAAFPDLDGVYFYGDYCSGRIWGASEDSPGVWSTQEVLDTPFLISAFGEDESGEIYFAHAAAAGEIYRLVSTAPGGVPCTDVQSFQARCVNAPAGVKLQARALLTDSSHDGETLTFDVDGAPQVVTISGNRAIYTELGAASGPHTVGLDDPPACFADIVVDCP